MSSLCLGDCLEGQGLRGMRCLMGELAGPRGHSALFGSPALLSTELGHHIARRAQAADIRVAAIRRPDRHRLRRWRWALANARPGQESVRERPRRLCSDPPRRMCGHPMKPSSQSALPANTISAALFAGARPPPSSPSTTRWRVGSVRTWAGANSPSVRVHRDDDRPAARALLRSRRFGGHYFPRYREPGRALLSLRAQ